MLNVNKLIFEKIILVCIELINLKLITFKFIKKYYISLRRDVQVAIYKLDERIIFSSPKLAEEDELVALDGDLSIERLILAYTNGIFPWYNKEDSILWWCPKTMFIINPKNIKISKSMKRIIKKENFEVKFDTDFDGVITNCKELREDKEGTWINNDMKSAYINLFKHGAASSVEVYKDEILIGGLYGVRIG